MWYDQNYNIIGNIFSFISKYVFILMYIFTFNLYIIDPLHTTVNSIGSATINALMTAKLGDTTMGTNRSKYLTSDNTSHVNEHKRNKPWSAVLHDIFVSLADDSTFLEHQNDVNYLHYLIKY
jgi:hypothetical protein